MSGALQRIKKDLDYHIKQIEENEMKIQSHRESIKTLEDCNKKEQRLVEEYEEIIQRIEG
ncbi:hypothetical protein [Bacillus sp. NTK034]|uniref:hypothetical protein n=1 Tax=Bacillus sp. NTK034 TaxID=2802176 RepID=UPI001A8E85E0|nr:hypothetical protein [Bacillus sp. NTK034]MBN8200517.1 hypothetical protein [Bacillus sp. NTK034]